MTMKSIILTIIVPIFTASILKAQEKPAKVKEYGIGLSSFNSFSLQYRWGTDKLLYRLQGNIGANTSFGTSSTNSTNVYDSIHSGNRTITTKSTSPTNINFGLSFSTLNLKSITDKFGLMYGGLLGISYRYNNTESVGTGTMTNNFYSPIGTYPDNTTSKNIVKTFQPYIGVVVGAYYKINTSFLVYAEISPNIFYAYTSSHTKITNTTNLSYTENRKELTNNFGLSNLSNSGAMITIVYRITK